MKQKYNIEMKPDGYFLARGRLRTKNPENLNLSEIIRNINTINENVNTAYDKALINDDKIVGQEKALILKYLEQLTGEYIILRYHFEKKFLRSSIANCIDLTSNYSFKIYLEPYEFTVSGRISEQQWASTNSLKQWFTEYESLLKTLLGTLRDALGDKKVTVDEVGLIAKPADQIIHMLIILQHRINNKDMDD